MQGVKGHNTANQLFLDEWLSLISVDGVNTSLSVSACPHYQHLVHPGF